MKRIVRGGVVALALLCGPACDDDAADGGGGSGGNDGAGGQGGAVPSCPVGAHQLADGSCAAELGPFSDTEALNFPRDHHVTFFAEKAAATFLYAAGGGVNMSQYEKSIERAPILADGSLGPWEVLGVEYEAAGPMIAQAGDTVALLGGQRFANHNKTVLLSVQEDGTLSAPTPGPNLNRARFHGAAVLVGDQVYATGGLDAAGTSGSTLERATLGNGSLGAFTVETSELPAGLSHHGLATDGQALYITGGLTRIGNDSQNDIGYNAVQRAAILPDGSVGAFSQVGTLPYSLAVHSSFVFAGRLYVSHGLNMDTMMFTKELWSAPLAEDGTLGAFEPLASAVRLSRGHCHQTPIINGVLYSVAGTNVGGSQDEVFLARFQ